MDNQRAALYECLAEALSDPPDWLALAGRAWPLARAARVLSKESASARQAAEALQEIDPEPLEARQNRYGRLFYQPGSIGPYESGALRGKLLTEETFAVERWYQQAGLRINGSEIPDHASLELAFLAHLCSVRPDEAKGLEKAFLRQHAGRWLPDLGKSMAASGDPVYAPIGRLLFGWLEEAIHPQQAAGDIPVGKDTKRKAGTHLPVLSDADACTLCSFCVQACPSKALSIEEDDRATTLFLAAERCSGCGKCTRVCPVPVLKMGARQQLSEGKILLRCSQRATCQACGKPMISQAELAYVAKQLDRPSWLAYCPDCRAQIPF